MLKVSGSGVAMVNPKNNIPKNENPEMKSTKKNPGFIMAASSSMVSVAAVMRHLDEWIIAGTECC